MKYKLRLLILSVAALIGGVAAINAQNVTTPYSMYGYGILGDKATSIQRQMGGVGYAMHSGRQINVMNPASYASIDSLTFLFDMGADLTFLWSKEDKARETSIGGGLDYVTMQFPIGKHFGGSIGLLPYTSVGYSFGNDIAHGARQHQGSGGINMAYLGFAANYFGVGLGFNVSYNFGSIVNDDFANPASGGQFLTEHVMEVRDWDLSLGLQYSKKVTAFDEIAFGFTYSPKKTLLGKTWVTVQETSQTTAPDTVSNVMKLKNNYYTPNSFGAGISYTHEKTSRLMVEADFTYQMWKDVKYSPLYNKDNGEVVFQGMQFDNRMKVAVGAELVPKIRGSYMERVAYRLGAYYCNDYLNILGNKMKEFGVTCGFGFRAPGDKTLINVGLEYKHRTTSPAVLISENYFNITIGLNFNELWFWQRKIR